MKIVFMGTPDFAIPTLEKLNEISDVRLVVSQVDKNYFHISNSSKLSSF